MSSLKLKEHLGDVAPDRVCPRCSGVARCVSSLGDSYKGLPGGTEYRYHCTCGEKFVIEGYGRLLFVAIASPVLLVLALNFAREALQRGRAVTGDLIFSAILALVALGMATQQALRLRLRHKAREINR